ncbi:MAG: hypothetical protein HKO72_01890, partial [Flavobacteriaceae bacterium]|nr:hypothetical protein [Bacteroidia bacterium]NNL60068.1 hypothetical protein [Flavobacteriaceae bacterium]
MNDKANNQIEKLADRLMKESSLESPSMDFTSQVMAKVDALAKSDVTAYRPLISKRVWTIVAIVMIASVVYLMFNGANEESILASVDLSVLSENKLTNAFSGLNFSRTIAYAVGILALMMA